MRWFQDFSEQSGRSDRFYDNSGHMQDVYHSTLRKCDILLTTRLEDSSHDCAIRPGFTHSFKDVLVVGANLNKDMSKETILQLARFVRAIFGAQPGS